jgi:hypothetical protein
MVSKTSRSYATKKSPIDAYRENVRDAEALVEYATILTHSNKNTMQSVLRDKVGDVFHINKKDRGAMDYIRNSDIILIFCNKSTYGRENIADKQPLFRPAVVGVCAAFETYLADKIMVFVGPLLRSKTPSPRLKEIPLTTYDWMEIEKTTKRGYAMRNIVERYIRENSSTAPNKVGEMLSLIGVKKWTNEIDKRRKTSPETTVRQLQAITDRRNKIAHAADRQGRSRGTLTIKQVKDYIAQVNDIVDALEDLLKDHTVP